MGGKNRRTENEINEPGISIFWKIFEILVAVLLHPPHSLCNHHFIAYTFYRKDFQYFVSDIHTRTHTHIPKNILFKWYFHVIRLEGKTTKKMI